MWWSGCASAALPSRSSNGAVRAARRALPTTRTAVTSAPSANILRDIEAFRRKIVLPDCPPPYFALGHSMGGAILAFAGRFLAPTFERLVLCAPKPASTTRHRTGRSPPAAAPCRPSRRRHAAHSRPGPPGEENAQLERNPLTSDPERYRVIEAITTARPIYQLNAPTLGWAAAATRLFDHFRRPDFPETIPAPVMLINCGGDLRLQPPCHRDHGASPAQPGLRADPCARHEILMEREVYAAQFWAAFDAFVPGSSE